MIIWSRKDSIIAVPKTSEQVVIAEWDPYATNPTIAEKAGIVSFERLFQDLLFLSNLMS